MNAWPLARTTLHYLAALAAMVAMTAAVGALLASARIANASMLYLLVVLPAAIGFGRGPAIFASVAAFLLFDWFFVVPFHTFTIKDPDEWLSLALFLVVAIITAELAARERVRARQAERREREAVLLLDTLRLIGEPGIESALATLAARIRSELHVEASGIELAVGSERHAAVSGDVPEAVGLLRPHPAQPTDAMRAGQQPTPATAGSPGRWIRIMPARRGYAFEVMGRWRRYDVPIRAGERAVGRLTLVRRAGGVKFGELEDRLLAVIATQLGLLVQRLELQHAATQADILRQTNELKSALLNAVSHDLRTPLASILASAGSLRQHDVAWTDSDRDEFALAIEQQTARLNRIVGNLLDLSRIEAGVLRPDRQLHDIGALIADVVERTGRAMTVRLAPDLPPVPLDYSEIDQVLSNLVENAVKYAPADSEIEIVCRRDGREVVVEVADRGPGVAAEEIPRLFEPFYRTAGGIARGGGLGLGLAVAKGLVEAHGGRIWFENRVGGGARFLFALPAAIEQPPSEERVPEGAR